MPFKVTWPFLTIMWIGGTDEVAYQNKGESKLYILRYKGLCTKNTSRALIERPYSCAPQAVGAVYDRPGFFVQSRNEDDKDCSEHPIFFPGSLYFCLRCPRPFSFSLQNISKMSLSGTRSWGTLIVKGFVYISGSSKVISTSNSEAHPGGVFACEISWGDLACFETTLCSQEAYETTTHPSSDHAGGGNHASGDI